MRRGVVYLLILSLDVCLRLKLTFKSFVYLHSRTG